MLFHKPSESPEDLCIQLRGTTLGRTESFKYLGLYLDETLSWDKHIGNLLPKLRATSRLIYRLRNTLDYQKLKCIYFAYFHSHVSYMSNIWGLTNQLLVSKVRVLQNGIIKTMYGVERLYPTNRLYEETRIPPLDVIMKAKLATILIHHVLQLKTINTEITASNLHHHHSTRSHLLIKLPKIFSVHYGLNGILYQSICLFNSLPNHIKLLVNKNSIKKQVNSHLLHLYCTGQLQVYLNSMDASLSL